MVAGGAGTRAQASQWCLCLQYRLRTLPGQGGCCHPGALALAGRFFSSPWGWGAATCIAYAFWVGLCTPKLCEVGFLEN